MSGIVVPPPVTKDDLNTLQSQIDQANAAYVNSGQPMLVADLLTNYPPTAATLGKYARASDLYGSVDDILRCRYDGTNYRWVPQRTEFNGKVNKSGVNNISPLFSPPTLRTDGGLTGNTTFSLKTLNAWGGQRYRIIIDGLLGLYTATLTGLLGSNLNLLGNSAKEMEFSAGDGGWFTV